MVREFHEWHWKNFSAPPRLCGSVGFTLRCDVGGWHDGLADALSFRGMSLGDVFVNLHAEVFKQMKVTTIASNNSQIVKLGCCGNQTIANSRN